MEGKKKKVRTVVLADIDSTACFFFFIPLLANAITVRGRADRFTFFAVAV